MLLHKTKPITTKSDMKRHTAKISMLYTPSIVSALINFSIEDIIQINKVKYKENTET